jgi:hypothetical protein
VSVVKLNRWVGGGLSSLTEAAVEAMIDGAGVRGLPLAQLDRTFIVIRSNIAPEKREHSRSGSCPFSSHGGAPGVSFTQSLESSP